MFQLDPTLNKDCFILGSFDLSLLLMMNDSNYPWCILVPQRAEISEIYQLSQDEQQQLMAESSQLSLAMDREFQADKMNIAALGNVVKQLHVHHVVRYQTDPCWPAPIWGKNPALAYTHEAQRKMARQIISALDNSFTPQAQYV